MVRLTLAFFSPTSTKPASCIALRCKSSLTMQNDRPMLRPPLVYMAAHWIMTLVSLILPSSLRMMTTNEALALRCLSNADHHTCTLQCPFSQTESTELPLSPPSLLLLQQQQPALGLEEPLQHLYRDHGDPIRYLGYEILLYGRLLSIVYFQLIMWSQLCTRAQGTRFAMAGCTLFSPAWKARRIPGLHSRGCMGC